MTKQYSTGKNCIRNIIRWIARIALLSLSCFGFMTLYSFYYNHYSIDANTVNVSWVYGLGGLIFFGLSFVNFKKNKLNEGKQGNGN